jgi:hypothetical protein
MLQHQMQRGSRKKLLCWKRTSVHNLDHCCLSTTKYHNGVYHAVKHNQTPHLFVNGPKKQHTSKHGMYLGGQVDDLLETDRTTPLKRMVNYQHKRNLTLIELFFLLPQACPVVHVVLDNLPVPFHDTQNWILPTC